MLIDWTSDFDRMLTGLETRADDGDSEATAQLEVINSQLAYLQALTEPPTEDTAVLKRVRQSRNNPVWRLSHPFRPGLRSGSSSGFRRTNRRSSYCSVLTRPAWVTCSTTAWDAELTRSSTS